MLAKVIHNGVGKELAKNHPQPTTGVIVFNGNGRESQRNWWLVNRMEETESGSADQTIEQ
jgi:hypothetical protein